MGYSIGDLPAYPHASGFHFALVPANEICRWPERQKQRGVLDQSKVKMKVEMVEKVHFVAQQ